MFEDWYKFPTPEILSTLDLVIKSTVESVLKLEQYTLYSSESEYKVNA